MPFYPKLDKITQSLKKKLWALRRKEIANEFFHLYEILPGYNSVIISYKNKSMSLMCLKYNKAYLTGFL